MLDTYQALATKAQVEFLSHRTSKLPPSITNHQPTTWGRPAKIYNPIHLFKILQNTDYLILKHVNNPLNLVPLILAPPLGIKVIIVIQQIKHLRFPGYQPLYRLSQSYLKAINAHLIATTKTSYDYLKNRFKHISYLPAAINTNRFKPATFAHKDRLEILTVAKFQPRKQLLLLTQTIQEFAKQYPSLPLHLTIIATQTSEAISTQTKKELHAYITNHNLQSIVTITEQVEYINMSQYYRDAHLFILPAYSEPLGYSVVEAMASGLPVITSNDVGAASYIKSGYNGYIFTAQSKNSLLEALRQIVQNNQVNWSLLQSLGAHSLQKAQFEHNPNQWIKSIIHK